VFPSSTKLVYIAVDSPSNSIVVFGLGPNYIDVQFDVDGTYDPKGNKLSFAWNFGDGKTSNLANPLHRYTEKKAYTATVKVTNSKGKFSEASKYLY
jgi:PKD repeat protein